MPPHITSMQLGLRISFRRIFWSSVWCQNHSFYSVSGPPAVFCFFRDELRDFRMINAPFLESSGHSLTPPYPKSQAPSEWQTSGWSLSFVLSLALVRDFWNSRGCELCRQWCPQNLYLLNVVPGFSCSKTFSRFYNFWHLSDIIVRNYSKPTAFWHFWREFLTCQKFWHRCQKDGGNHS